MRPLIEISDEILMDRLKNNDEMAFEEIYNRYWLKAFRIAKQKLNSKELAEELIQDLFSNFWLKRNSIQINLNLEAYLMVSIRNLVISHVRSYLIKEKRTSQIESHFLAENNIENLINEAELNNAFNLAVEKLPEKSREVFSLSRFEHKSTLEIADNLNISHKTVEYHISKSLKFLRIHLKDFVLALALAFRFYI